MGVAGINENQWGYQELMGVMGARRKYTRVNGGCRILDIGWGLSEFVDIKGGYHGQSGRPSVAGVRIPWTVRQTLSIMCQNTMDSQADPQ